MQNIKIVQADFSNGIHKEAFKYLMNVYASGLTGGGVPINDDLLEASIHAIPQRQDSLVLLLFVDDAPAAIANCFEGFSTFKGKPLLNIHDFAVDVAFRGKGLAKKLLLEIERISKERGYCKITLEVLEGNKRAKKVYIDFGFKGYELDDEMGKALFWEKPLLH